MTALGLPIAIALCSEVSLFALSSLLLSPLGADVVASHQIALNTSAVAFSQAHYSETELQRYLTETTENDAVVLWQDGVLLAVKYGEMFTQCKGQCFMLEQDVLARNLTALLPENNQVRSISLADLVDLTAQYSPQIAL